MNIKIQLICLSIVAVLPLCAFNNVVAAPSIKLTPNTHGNVVLPTDNDTSTKASIRVIQLPTDNDTSTKSASA